MSGPFVKPIITTTAPPAGGGPPLIAQAPPSYCYAKFASRGRGNLNPDGPVLDMTYGTLSGEYLQEDGTGPRIWDKNLAEEDGLWVYTKCIKTTPFPDPYAGVNSWYGFWAKRRYSTVRKCMSTIRHTADPYNTPPVYYCTGRNTGGSTSIYGDAVLESADNAIGKPGYQEVVSFYHDQVVNGTPYPNAIGNKGMLCYLSADPNNVTTPFCTTLTRNSSMYNDSGSSYGLNFLRAYTGDGNMWTNADWYLVEVACGNNYALTYNDTVTLLQNGVIATFGLWG